MSEARLMKESDVFYLTTDDFKEIVKDENTIFIIPTGSIEQHGPHLPLLTDSIIASEIMKRVRNKIKSSIKIVILPTLTYGCSFEHIDFLGTITLRLETYLKVIEDIISSLTRYGAKKIVIANAHGGNSSILRSLVFEYSQRYNIFITIVEIFKICAEAFKKYRDSTEIGAFHAGEMETSIMLYLYEEVVKKELKQLKENYQDPRRTRVHITKPQEITEEDLIPEEETIITLTQRGYIKRVDPTIYKAQHRGGKGIIGVATTEAVSYTHLTLPTN